MWPHSNHIFTPYGAEPLIDAKIGCRADRVPPQQPRRSDERAARSTQSFFINRGCGRTTYDATYTPHEVSASASRSTSRSRRLSRACSETAACCPSSATSLRSTYRSTHGAAGRMLRPDTAKETYKPLSTYRVSPGLGAKRNASAIHARSVDRVRLGLERRTFATSYRYDYGVLGSDPRDRLLRSGYVDRTVAMNEAASMPPRSIEAEHTQRRTLAAARASVDTSRTLSFTHSGRRAATDVCTTQGSRTSSEFSDNLAMIATTAHLWSGTKRSHHPCGSMVHVPSNARNRAKMHDSIEHGVDHVKAHSRDLMRHRVTRHLPRYSGFQPRALRNDVSIYTPVRPGPTAQARAHTGRHFQEQCLRAPTENNLRKYIVSTRFQDTTGSGKGDGAARAEAFYNHYQPLEGRVKYGAPEERLWIRDRDLMRTHMSVGHI